MQSGPPRALPPTTQEVPVQKSPVFGALRATTIAALCAGAGLALAGCDRNEAAAGVQTKPATGTAGAAKAAATEKPAADNNCGGTDKKCGGDNKCGGSDKK
jgi:hypothetical protein